MGLPGGEVDGCVEHAVKLEFLETGEGWERGSQQVAHVRCGAARRVENAEGLHLGQLKTGRNPQDGLFLRQPEGKVLQLGEAGERTPLVLSEIVCDAVQLDVP